MTADAQQRSCLLKKIEAIIDSPVVLLEDIKPPSKIVGKGRPTGTKRLPSAIDVIEKNQKKKIKYAKANQQQWKEKVLSVKVQALITKICINSY